MTETIFDDEDQDILAQCGELFHKECSYYDVDDLKDITVPGGSEYRVMHHNIQSLPSKFDDLKILLDFMSENDKKTDFFLLCKTFLTTRNEDMFEINVYKYNFVCRNRSKPRGGVALYIKETIHFSERTDLSINIEGEFESIFIEAKSNKHRFIVGEIYRTPGTNTYSTNHVYLHRFSRL